MYFGMYSNDDIVDLETYQGIKYVIWAGSDIDDRITHVKDNIKRIKKIKCKTHFAVSKSVQERLTKHGIQSTLINFSLINKKLYNNAVLDDKSRSKRIYVYNGNGNDLIYNTALCDTINARMSSKYEFVYRTDINFNDEQMIEFYQSCFMGIRLCENDGNANTVQEMGLLGLPVLHNSLIPNAVAWMNDINYICEKIDYVYNNFQDKKSIISDSVHKFLNNDEREEMCIFVPMWYRHETTRKNLHLLTQQDYFKTRIIEVL